MTVTLSVVSFAVYVTGSATVLVNGKQRVVGYFVRDDGKKLTIRERSADGKEKDVEFDRAKVKVQVLFQLDRLLDAGSRLGATRRRTRPYAGRQSPAVAVEAEPHEIASA